MTTLKSHLESLASSFADSVLAAIRARSLEDLPAESGARRTPQADGGKGGQRRLPKRSGGRLARRSLADIEKTLDLVVSAVKASNGKGLRAEEIRQALSLDVREVPRVLKEGLKSKKLRAQGQKRATTYFAR
jgi:hypothetical protein